MSIKYGVLRRLRLSFPLLLPGRGSGWGSSRRQLALLAVLMTVVISGCGSSRDSETSEIIVASTTSTSDSGLFDELLPAFQAAYSQYRVVVSAVGTGEALKLGERCDADVVLVHSPEAEKKFVADGFGTERREVMYNDFVIVGPHADPAGIDGSTDAVAAFKKIAGTGSPFISRGDDSGTNKAELKLWEKAGLGKPAGAWYRSIGQGMGEALRIADETQGYTLADRGTWLSMKDKLPGLEIVVEGDQALFNQYGVIPVSPDRCPDINSAGAQVFADWLVSPEGQKVIGDYGKEKYGQALFVPNAKDVAGG